MQRSPIWDLYVQQQKQRRVRSDQAPLIGASCGAYHHAADVWYNLLCFFRHTPHPVSSGCFVLAGAVPSPFLRVFPSQAPKRLARWRFAFRPSNCCSNTTCSIISFGVYLYTVQKLNECGLIKRLTNSTAQLCEHHHAARALLVLQRGHLPYPSDKCGLVWPIM